MLIFYSESNAEAKNRRVKMSFAVELEVINIPYVYRANCRLVISLSLTKSVSHVHPNAGSVTQLQFTYPSG